MSEMRRRAITQAIASTVCGQEVLSRVLEGEPFNHVDLLLNLHGRQEVKLAIVTLELSVQLVRLVLLLCQHNNLPAVVTNSQEATGHVKGERRDPVVCKLADALLDCDS